MSADVGTILAALGLGLVATLAPLWVAARLAERTRRREGRAPGATTDPQRRIER